jgi:hypothetical protein
LKEMLVSNFAEGLKKKQSSITKAGMKQTFRDLTP